MWKYNNVVPELNDKVWICLAENGGWWWSFGGSLPKVYFEYGSTKDDALSKVEHLLTPSDFKKIHPPKSPHDMEGYQ